MTGRTSCRGDPIDPGGSGPPEGVLHSIVESLPARIFWKDRESRYLGCNTPFAEDAGFANESEVVGKTDFEMGWREQAEAYRRHDNAVMTSGIPELGFEEPQTTPEGGTRWLSTSKVPLRDKANQIIGILGIYEDVTQRKHSDEALKDSEERNRTIIETAMDGFWLANTRGRLLAVNEAYCRMSGYSSTELLAMKILDLDIAIDPDPTTSALVRRVREEGEHRFETRHRRKDGTIFDVEVSVQFRAQDGGQLVLFLRDVTARKRAEEALRASEARYRSILNASPDAVGLAGIDGRLLMASPMAMTMLRVEREEDVLGRRVTDFLVPEDRERALSRIAGLIAGDPPRPNEYMGLRLDGTTFDVDVNSQFVRGADGQPHEMVFLIRDITARKQAEAALRASEERHRRILEAALDGFCLLDREGRVLEVNDAYCRMSGYSAAELLAMRISDLSTRETVESASTHIRAIIERGADRFESEHRRKDGSLFAIEASVQYLPLEGGRLVVFLRDITERKRAATALQQSHDMITKLAAQVPGVIYQYRMDPDGRSRFPFASPGVTDIYELTPEQVREDATPALERVHKEDLERLNAAVQESFRSLEPFHCEFRVVLPRRGLRWCLCDAVPERTETGGALWHGIISDITDRKQAEDALNLSLHEKEGLLREVHHRVKNNLQVITSLLRLETSRSDIPDTKRVLKDMQGRILSMALLHETLYRSGRFGQVDLANYLQTLSQQLFRASSASAFLRLEFDLSPVHVPIEQAIPCGLIANELLTNSLKHAFAETESGEVRVSLRQDALGEIRFRVSDTGVGLPGEFETKRGKSLGLQLVSDLTRQLGGRLEIGPGPGAGFAVIFSPARPHTTAPMFPPATEGLKP